MSLSHLHCCLAAANGADWNGSAAAAGCAAAAASAAGVLPCSLSLIWSNCAPNKASSERSPNFLASSNGFQAAAAAVVEEGAVEDSAAPAEARNGFDDVRVLKK